jgi:hypothetical protein
MMWDDKVVSVHILTEHHAMKAHWGNGGIAIRILDLSTRWRWAVGFTPRPLYPQGKNSRYPLYSRLSGSQSRSGRGGEEKNSYPLPELEPPIIQPVAQCYTTELSWLRNWCNVHWTLYVKSPYYVHKTEPGMIVLACIYVNELLVAHSVQWRG